MYRCVKEDHLGIIRDIIWVFGVEYRHSGDGWGMRGRWEASLLVPGGICKDDLCSVRGPEAVDLIIRFILIPIPGQPP